jgi:REP element-mobilizing transposase RayT
VAGEEDSDAMQSEPLYNARDQQPAFALRYTWCGWATSGDLRALPDDGWTALTAAWETDGLRLLERELRRDSALLTFSATPEVGPVFLAARAKGRLQHAFRTSAAAPIDFSRKVAVRSVGENTSSAIQAYIEAQIHDAEFIDPRFAEFLEQFTFVNSSVDLSQPTETGSGRYWYNLHVVLVTDGRCRCVDSDSLTSIRDGSFRIAEKKGYQIASLSVMPDHLHVALRAQLEHAPQEVALSLQNNLAYMLRKGAIWRPGYYVGTFGEYNMNAIRRAVRLESSSPAGQAGRGRS